MDEKFVSDYAKLDNIANPFFVEPKGYVFVGYSRKRMTINNMPPHDKVKDFGEKLAGNLGYDIVMEKPDSRVVLLSQKQKWDRFDK